MDERDKPSVKVNGNGFGWMDADAYLFDIDGTLLNVRDRVHWNALSCAMREAYEVDASIEGIAYHGKTDLGILRAALERAGVWNETFDASLELALEVVRREVAQNAGQMVARVCRGIPELLSKLQQAGKLLAVASGNLEAVGWQKVKAARLSEFFAFGKFSDHCEFRDGIFQEAVTEVRRRLGPDAKACFVGDTPADIRAAQAAGAQVIAVGTGIYSTQELMEHGPDACVGCCADLKEES